MAKLVPGTVILYDGSEYSGGMAPGVTSSLHSIKDSLVGGHGLCGLLFDDLIFDKELLIVVEQFEIEDRFAEINFNIMVVFIPRIGKFTWFQDSEINFEIL